MGIELGQHGPTPALIGSLRPNDLAKAISLLPADVYQIRYSHNPVLSGHPDQIPALGEVKQGGLADRDGSIVARRAATHSSHWRYRLPYPQGFTECFRLPNSDSNRASDMFLKMCYPILNPLYSTVGVTLPYVRPVKAQRIRVMLEARSFQT